MKLSASALSVFIALGGGAAAAPPTVTSLFPAGGQRGTSVEVTATGTFDAWPVKVWASDPAVSVSAKTEKGKLDVAVAAAANPGVCWLRAYNDTGASPLRPFVVGTLPEVAEVEPNDSPAKPQRVERPAAVVNGKLAKPGDVDVFAMKLVKGRTLVARVDAHDVLRSPMDSVLQVAAADGTVLAQNHDHRGLDPQLTFAAPADGTYLVRLFAFPSQPDSSIRHFGSDACVYRLTLTSGGVIDYATPLAVEKGKEATLTLHGWNLSVPTLRLAAADDRYHPPWSATGGAVAREPHPCYDLTAGPRPDPIPPPFTVTGRLNKPGEPTTVTVVASKAAPLLVRLDAASLGSPLTPILRVFGTGPKPLSATEPAALNTDLETIVNPPADGPVRFEVRDLYGDGGPRFVYRLHVTPSVPDFAPTAATDRYVVTAGQPLDVPVTMNPKRGFAAELDWTVDGLPAGTTVRAVPPAGKPDSKTTTLRFETKTTTAAGAAIRISAAVKAGPAARRTVTAKPDGFDTDTAEIWLTTLPAPAEKPTPATPVNAK